MSDAHKILTNWYLHTDQAAKTCATIEDVWMSAWNAALSWESSQDRNQNEWRPIDENTPMDFSILLAAANTKTWQGHWCKKYKCWTRENFIDKNFEPTHWQPLPPPPQSGEKEGE